MLALWAPRIQRYSGWHRRLTLVVMSALTGSGIGRLLPMQAFLPPSFAIQARRALFARKSRRSAYIGVS